MATTFTHQTAGVDNETVCTRFTEVFDTLSAVARFDWRSTQVLDNLLLVRRTIR